MHRDQRRQQLIDIALHLFATHGFRGTTTRAIADAAGVSEAMLFRHFPTKDDLYRAILQHKAGQDEIARMLESLRRGMDGDDDEAVVGLLARKVLETYERDSDFQRVLLRAALERHDLASLSRQILGLPVFALFRDYVVKRQASGAFRAGDPALQAFSLMALPVYFAILTSLFGVRLGAPSHAQAAETFTTLILDGLRAPDGAAGAGRAAAPGATRRTAAKSRRRRRLS